MRPSTFKVRLAGGLVAACAFGFIVIVVSGQGQDLFGSWWLRCGGRFSRHDCAPGEIPWSQVATAAMLGTVGALVAFGGIAVRRAGVSVRTRLEVRRSGSIGPPPVDTSGSVPPPGWEPTPGPPRRPPEPTEATDVEGLARRIGL